MPEHVVFDRECEWANVQAQCGVAFATTTLMAAVDIAGILLCKGACTVGLAAGPFGIIACGLCLAGVGIGMIVSGYITAIANKKCIEALQAYNDEYGPRDKQPLWGNE